MILHAACWASVAFVRNERVSGGALDVVRHPRSALQVWVYAVVGGV